jgi:hypothetical protein
MESGKSGFCNSIGIRLNGKDVTIGLTYGDGIFYINRKDLFDKCYVTPNEVENFKKSYKIEKFVYVEEEEKSLGVKWYKDGKLE